MSRKALTAGLLVSACFEPYPLQRSMEGSTTDETASTTVAGDGVALTTISTSVNAATSTEVSTGELGGLAFDDEYVILQYSLSLVVESPGVLGNDVGDNLDLLEIGEFTTERGGTVDMSADGSFTYIPPQPFWGHDGFTYTATGSGGPDTAHVDILVRPTFIRLEDVAAGFGGFAIAGATAQSHAGYGVGGGGDVNGDGINDVVIGAPDGDLSGTGRAYVIYGSNESTNIDLINITDGPSGFAIVGSPPSSSIGHAVSLGDTNADGYADVIVGDPDGNEATGSVAVIFGNPDPHMADISNLGPDGYVLFGSGLGNRSGWAVSTVEDTDSDGMRDIAISERSYADRGYVYIIAGKDSAEDGPIVTKGAVTWRSGEEFGDQLGTSLASVSDVNGDGFGDFIAGAPGALGALGSPSEAGASYLFYSNGYKEFKFAGAFAYDHSGTSVAGGFDLNGDTFADIVIGAPGAGLTGPQTGLVYFVFGPFAFYVSLIRLSDGFLVTGADPGDAAGTSVAMSPDINGDGLADTLIGAPFATGTGRAYVVYGRNATGSVSLTDISTGLGGFAVEGEADGDWAGYALAAPGDVNGDGVPDIVIGAYRSDVSGSDSGCVYVLYGIKDKLLPVSG